MYLVEMLEELSDAAFSIDGDARIVNWSPGAEKLLGYDARSVVGELCADILQGIYPSGEPMCTAMCEALTCFKLDNNHTVDACLLRHKDGYVFPARIDSVQLSAGDDKAERKPVSAVMFLQKSATAVPISQSNQLRIFALGHFSLVCSGKGMAVDNWKRKQALTVLKILVDKVNRPIHRDTLIKTLWPEAKVNRGWERLKVAISFLRSQLQQSGVDIEPVLTLDQSYMLRGDVVWIDATEFENQVIKGNRYLKTDRIDEALACFEIASRLYSGDFLEDDLQADWCSKKRERLRECYFDMLADMAKCQAIKGDHQAAARSCQRALYRDQSRENFLRSLIESLGKIDHSKWKKSQHDIWQRIQDKEFEIVPKPEHMHIFEELIRTSKDDPEVPE
ncbi:MAG: PAS domain-containing protein [Hyphomicrobiales bacterium]|nr:PAS domain-containing protein [Hyphomicrobiales bacterium]